MNGSTLLQAHPGPRQSSFDRPPTLKIPITSTSDFGKSAWTSNRTFWQTNGGSAAPKSDSLADRPDPLRQISNSSIKFGRSSNGGTALSPIENSRGSAKPAGLSWSGLTVSPINTRHQGQLIPPGKQKHQAWPFSDDLDFDSENSLLLHGSAPDIDPMEEQHGHSTVPVDEGPSLHLDHGSNGLSFYDHQNGNSRYSIRSDAFTNHAGLNGPSSRQGQGNGLFLATEISPTGHCFETAGGYTNGAQITSPTSTRFAINRKQGRYTNNTQQRGAPSVDNNVDAMRSLTLNDHSSHGVAGRSGSENFRNPTFADIQGHQNGPNGVIPHLRLSADQAEFRPSGFSSSFEPVENGLGSSQYPSMWTHADRISPYTSDFKSNIHGAYYSANATPPTGGLDSGRSAGGSGISSRTSNHDFALVDRKLGNLDSYQQGAYYQSNGILPINGNMYDFSLPASTMRMNPLATPYSTPYSLSVSGFSSVGYSPTPRLPLRETEPPQVIRSPLLEEFRMTGKTNKRYELRDIFNHIVEFSGDQHGSRFIQQKLETANSDEKDQVFKEIQPNCLQLMTDVFGNYVIQKMFEHGNQSQKKVLANHIKGHVLNLSTQMYGCRVVQKALEHVLMDQQASMIKELDGPNKQVLKVIRDQNGNHVVQKAIERVPAEHIQFIIEAHRGEVVKLATHTYGCRVIQRILEHCQPAAKRIILDELHGCVAPLITDSFGNYVVQHVIQTGEADDRRRVVSIVQQQVLVFSKHKFASNVVEKCIEHADADQRADLVGRLIGHNEQGQTPVLGLLRDQYGNYVIQKVHSLLKGAELEALTNEMRLCFPQLKRTSYGKQVMAIEKLLYDPHNGAAPGFLLNSGIDDRTGPSDTYMGQQPRDHAQVVLPVGARTRQ